MRSLWFGRTAKTRSAANRPPIPCWPRQACPPRAWTPCAPVWLPTPNFSNAVWPPGRAASTWAWPSALRQVQTELALAAVADTGSCLVEDTDENVRLATMLPDISLLLLPEGAVLPDLSAAGTVVRDALSGDAPRRLTFITGPSRTADIERVLTLGVHGPLELHILLLPPALLAEAHSYQGE